MSKIYNAAMAGYLADGSPLKTLIQDAAQQAALDVENALLTGIATGQGANTIAYNMEQAANLPHERVIRIARTEINRAYRAAANEQYKAANGVIAGYRRLCFKPTACFACLMLDGEFYPLSTPLEDHPNGKCTSIPITGSELEEHARPEWQTGKEWFMEQDEETQRKLMGPGRFDLWQSGQVSLGDMVYIKPNSIWGGSPSIRSLKELNMNAGGPIWTAAAVSEIRKIVMPLEKSVRNDIIENGLKRLNFTHHLDKMGAYAENMNAYEDYQDVIVHGNKFGFCFQDANNPDSEDSTKPFRQDDISVEELAAFLRKSEAYKGGKIRLVSCGAGGAGGFAAQALADELGVIVIAPTETLYNDYEGNSKIVGEDGINGEWAFFEPSNRPK